MCVCVASTQFITFDFQVLSHMASSIHRISFLIMVATQCCSAANIFLLFFPLFGHITGPANVAKVLQDQGHKVTIAIPSQLQDKLEGKGVNILVYDSLEDVNVHKELEKIVLEIFFQETFFPIHFKILNLIEKISDKILRDEQLVKNILSHRPDLIIMDSTGPARMLTIIPYKLDISFLFMGPEMEPQFSRTPILPSVVPNKGFELTDQMTFLQWLLNTLIQFMTYFFDPFTFTDVNIYAPEKPYISMYDPQAKALFWIITEDSILGYSSPSMPYVKQISHLLTVTPKPLLPKFQFFMDNAKDGVVIVSFGSVLQSMPPAMVDKLLEAFKKTKYNFVIQHPVQLNSSDPGKILFGNWLPQYDLLCHKNTRLFITHCGANGQQESVLAGVPMIGFPVFAEQPNNAGRMVRKGFGLRLNPRSFSVEEMVSAIEEVITNPEYKMRTQKASAIIKAQRVPPLEEAAFWINHILTFGGDHLRSSGQDIPLWQYLGLDVLVACLLVCHIVGFIFIKMLCFCIFCCFKRKGKVKNE